MYKDIDWSTDKMTTTGGVGVGAGRFMAYSPSPSAPHSPHISALRSSAASSALVVEQEKYLSELLAERHKITPFLPVLPNTYRLLNQALLEIYNFTVPGVDGFAFNKMDGKYLRKRSSNIQSGLGIFGLLVVQTLLAAYVGHRVWQIQTRMLKWAEILRVTTLLGNASVLGQSGLEHASPLASGGTFSNGAADANGWASRFQSEMTGILHPSSAQNWLSSQGSSSGLIVKRTIRVDIPVDKYPNYNFVGRLLGPRGNSLKRVEASTECRVLIRGRGSIKDPAREDMMRGKPGYEHLNEPLHILVEGELPVEIVDARLMQAREILEDLLKPVDESQDYYKKQQLRELAMLNGTFREEGSPMSGSVSPFNNSLGMKRAKTRG
ncbi:RNA-BINDING PROTEIN RELATED [Salix koriyanagi]|uniref:RNA-BINDING PROTEIN RELATED n=2 Tax=Salix TaxID=40685 RepID=A0A9Q0X2S6_9ROSI|nr:RNA-BINDING PROTEIN RELATED [Salix koriyanagi]